MQIALAQSSQAYSDEIYIESTEGFESTFIVKGKSFEKKSLEENAKKAIIYNILYRGVENVNEGKPIITPKVKENKSYTADFFNSAKKYESYIEDDDVKSVTKTEKSEGGYQCTYRIKVKLHRLIKDLEKNAVNVSSYNTWDNDDYGDNTSSSTQNFSIMVVPMKQKKSESYIELYKNNRNLRTAATKVQEAFGRFNIETQNVTALESLLSKKSEYAESAGITTSNERELLLASGADILVEVDLDIIQEPNGKKASININAYEIATLSNWASGVFESNVISTNDAAGLCAKALEGKVLGNFIKKINSEFNKPISLNLEFTLSSDVDFTYDDRNSDGDTLGDLISTWIEENSYEGVDDPKGENNTTIYYDNLTIPRNDENGKRMTIAKFARKLSKDLYKLGVDNKYTTDGKLVTITILSKPD
jgi:hypothetical protein